jgi:hypothetical protein
MIGHHPRGVKVILGENQILPIKKFRNRFFQQIEKANISQLFLLDKLVSGQGL